MQPLVDVEGTARLIVGMIAVVHAFIWWQTSYAEKVPRATRRCGRLRGAVAGGGPATTPDAAGGDRATEIGRVAGRLGRHGVNARAPAGSVGSLQRHAVRAPAPDLAKLLTAWEEWERGEETPGKVLANMKTAGLPTVLHQLVDSGWAPAH